MKRFLVFLLILGAITLNAQKATVIVSEDFSGGVIPAGWTVDAHSSNWLISSTKNAGGDSPELDFYWSPSWSGTSHFISPVYDASTASSLILKFKQYLSDYGGGYTIGVATTSDSGATWNTVWSVAVSGDIDAEDVTAIINNGDLDTNFQFCFYFSGNNYNLNDWYIDNIQLIQAGNLDLAASSINNKIYQSTGVKNINATVSNYGETSIGSFDINYQINSGTVVTESVTGLDLSLADSYTYTFAENWNPTPGDYEVKLWVSSVNGTGDEDQTNDTITKVIHIASQEFQRTVLYEEFTSSTCSPCATFNSNYFTSTFLDDNAGKYALIKYQMSWPAPGDPYYTDEGGVRRAYYGVSGVPTLFTDAQAGTFFNTTQLQNDLNEKYANPAFIDMAGQYCILGDVIHFYGEVTPYLNANNFTMQVAVVEGTTTGNVASNGETEFYNVMMKMLPDASGTPVSFNDGQLMEYYYSNDMSTTNVEEMSDLKVAFFIQNDDGHEVFQSSNCVLNEKGYSIIPEDGAVDVPIDEEIIVDFIPTIRFIDDSEISDALISSFITVEDDSSTPYAFTATIDSTKHNIIIIPDGYWPTSTHLNVTVAGTSIEDSYDNALEDSTLSFTTGTEVNIKENSSNINVYPIPADDYINIVCPVNANITITSANGVIVRQAVAISEKTEMNVADLATGVYFVNIRENDKIQIVRFIKR